VERWGSRYFDKRQFNIGFCWSGNPAQGDNVRRSFSPRDMLPIFRMPDVGLFVLQKGCPDDHPDIPKGVVRLGAEYEAGDWLETAAVLANLDLIITPCTGIAHLAAAMGRPVWMANWDPGDWRWGVSGETTPWYPSMRIFRQVKRGTWDGVFDAMARRLRRLRSAA
jgi:Glycosyltransferase family 9 (heptosyltransferase)